MGKRDLVKNASDAKQVAYARFVEAEREREFNEARDAVLSTQAGIVFMYGLMERNGAWRTPYSWRAIEMAHLTGRHAAAIDLIHIADEVPGAMSLIHAEQSKTYRAMKRDESPEEIDPDE